MVISGAMGQGGFKNRDRARFTTETPNFDVLNTLKMGEGGDTDLGPGAWALGPLGLVTCFKIVGKDLCVRVGSPGRPPRTGVFWSFLVIMQGGNSTC